MCSRMANTNIPGKHSFILGMGHWILIKPVTTCQTGRGASLESLATAQF